jgi:hypothetical protein
MSIYSFSPSSKGLIKQTMSLNDLLSILEHYRDLRRCKQYVNIEKGMREPQEQTDKDLIFIKQILESISVNIWKCFHISNALHPYSAEALVSINTTSIIHILDITVNQFPV